MSATAAVRKQQERERKREAGLVPVQEWVHRDDAERLRKYASKLRKAGRWYSMRSRLASNVNITGTP